MGFRVIYRDFSTVVTAVNVVLDVSSGLYEETTSIMSDYRFSPPSFVEFWNYSLIKENTKIEEWKLIFFSKSSFRFVQDIWGGIVYTMISFACVDLFDSNSDAKLSLIFYPKILLLEVYFVIKYRKLHKWLKISFNVALFSTSGLWSHFPPFRVVPSAVRHQISTFCANTGFS